MKKSPQPPFAKGGILHLENIFNKGNRLLIYEGRLKPLSRELRKRMTDAENLLWSKIRRKQLADCQFYRQRIIGKWIVDFYCPKAKLVIEIDGAQHLEDIGIERDRQRDHHLQRLGLTVVRFLDDEIFNHLDEVLEKIYIFLSRNNPPFVKGD